MKEGASGGSCSGSPAASGPRLSLSHSLAQVHRVLFSFGRTVGPPRRGAAACSPGDAPLPGSLLPSILSSLVFYNPLLPNMSLNPPLYLHPSPPFPSVPGVRPSLHPTRQGRPGTEHSAESLQPFDSMCATTWLITNPILGAPACQQGSLCAPVTLH